MPKVTYCSFCGRSSNDAGRMIEGTDKQDTRQLVRICKACAEYAIEVIDRVTSEERGLNPE